MAASAALGTLAQIVATARNGSLCQAPQAALCGQRHTRASGRHRQAGTSWDELKDLGGWKFRNMVDRYAKYATENLAVWLPGSIMGGTET